VSTIRLRFTSRRKVSLRSPDVIGTERNPPSDGKSYDSSLSRYFSVWMSRSASICDGNTSAIGACIHEDVARGTGIEHSFGRGLG